MASGGRRAAGGGRRRRADDVIRDGDVVEFRFQATSGNQK